MIETNQHHFGLTSDPDGRRIILYPPSRITGIVTDGKSGSRISEFEIKVGFLFGGSSDFHEETVTGKSVRKLADGTFEILFSQSFDRVRGIMDRRVLRVEAKGYNPVISRPFDDSEENVRLDFVLTKRQ